MRKSCLKCLVLSRSSDKTIIFISNLRTNSSKVASSNNREDLSDEEIEKLRNISRLNDYLRSKLDHAAKLQPFTKIWHLEKKYHRRLYARFGRESGINPGIMWPTNEELSELIGHEDEWEPSLQDRLQKSKSKADEEEENYKQKEALVLENLSKMKEHEEEAERLKLEKEKEAAKAAEKKQKLMEELQEEFGMRVDPRDPRIKELIERKQKEEDKRLKQERKKAKEAKMVAKLLSGQAK